MREYPKETHSYMLLMLSEKIYVDVLYPVTIFKTDLIDYLDNPIESFLKILILPYDFDIKEYKKELKEFNKKYKNEWWFN